MIGARLLAFGLGALAWTGGGRVVPRTAAAAPDESARVAALRPAPRLEVTIVGSALSCEALAAALAPMLSGDERVVLKREPGSPSPAEAPRPIGGRAGIWIEAERDGSILIAAMDGNGSGVARMIDGAASPPVTAEIVAQIVRQTADAMLAHDAPEGEGRLPAPRGPPELDQSPPPSTPIVHSDASRPVEQSRPFMYAIGLAYFSRPVSADNVWRALVSPGQDEAEHGVGGSFGVLTRAAPFGLAGALVLDRATIPTSLDGASRISTPGGGAAPTADVTRWSGRAMGGPVYRPHSWLEVALAAGAGVDRVAAGPGITAASPNWIAAARAMFRASLLFPGSGLEVDAAATLDVRERTAYAQPVMFGGGYNGRPVQAGLSLGLGWRR